MQNEPETYIRVKRSYFRCFKRFIQREFCANECEVEIEGIFSASKSFTHCLTQKIGSWISTELKLIKRAVHDAHVYQPKKCKVQSLTEHKTTHLRALSEMFGDICYRYRKQRKEDFLRNPLHCLLLLCFMENCISHEFESFNRNGKVWTEDIKGCKTYEIKMVFLEIVKLI
jgi:hypothetical protein